MGKKRKTKAEAAEDAKSLISALFAETKKLGEKKPLRKDRRIKTTVDAEESRKSCAEGVIDTLSSKKIRASKKAQASLNTLALKNTSAPDKVAKSFDEEMKLNGVGKRIDGKTRTYTEEGWPIYTMEELKLGQGGGTKLCPFECECCF
ncbi:hypothetical protein GNI_081900 [Gregarina niphandrodes]|uniref:DUF1764 family protein n=1 Tax=Gregarina niphandrodes TaxID=110365 RepID=A0A023B677_GRENI|nr:hypothetical protein GNI_081900 [Gregarina niphandrodes]EZG65889.1 hypothetical protein GNI_081900 [Gregarina niphandrodes]|eukprot:XP_011134047.1 hypothetical protein GNI_081900 [Gregarina niphandrodes]